MSPWEQAAAGWAAASAWMAALWLAQRARRDAGIVDAGWAAALAGLAGFYAATGAGHPHRRVLTAALAGAWGLRLCGHLLLRLSRAAGEDGRYRALRERWGEAAHPRFFLFFQAQALLSSLLSLPFLLQCRDPRPPGIESAAAVLLWLVSVGGETLADLQLSRFRARPESRGRTCREGLWRLSRHPNYFFEWLHWGVYPLLALPTAAFWPSLLPPALMLWFLLKITGIPATEEQALKSRGEDYRDYQRKTSMFLPRPPRGL